MRTLIRITALAASTVAPALGQSPCSTQTKILPTIPTTSFGRSVDLDQGRLLVGSPGYNAAVSSDSTAFVFTDGPNGWVLEEVLDGPDHGNFGDTVALDGDTAVIGARGEESFPGVFGGAVHVFRDSGGWTLEARLVLNDAVSDDRFGDALAIQGDELMVGAPFDDTTNGIGSGSVTYFKRTPSGWIQGQKLKPSDGIALMRFGSSIALDGTRLLASAPEDKIQGLPTAGSVYLFEFDGAQWTETAKLVAPSPGINHQFGTAVALDGSRAAITGRISTPEGKGGAYLYQWTGASWTLEDTLFATDNKDLTFDVELEGDQALIGGFGAAEPVALYRRSGGAWSLEQTFGLDQLDPFGGTVALSGDRVAIGASGDDQLGAGVGAAYVSDLIPAPAVYCTAKLTSNGCVPVIDSAGAPSAAGLTPFPISAREIPNQKPGLLFYGRTGPAALPFLGGTLCVLPPLVRTPVQTSGGNPPPADCSGAYLVDFATIAPGDPNLGPGDAVHAQYWFRDPGHPDGTGAGLSDALSLELCD